MINGLFPQVLKARDDHVGTVLDDAKAQLVSISKDGARYPKIIEGLIAQGVCQLLESQVRLIGSTVAKIF